MKIETTPEVQALLHESLIGILEIDSVTVEKKNEALDSIIKAKVVKICSTPKRDDDDMVLQGVHMLHKQAGFPSSRYRPSSEAMLHRLKNGKGMPQINSIVDINNYCSLVSWLPICVYDLDKIEGNLQLHIGRPGEFLNSIGGQQFDLSEKLILSDSVNILGTLIADSRVAMITLETKGVLFITYASPMIPKQYVQEALLMIKDLVMQFCGGTRFYEELIEI